MKRMHVVATVAAVLATLVVTAPAQAFTAPELFVRMQTWDTHEAASDWIPLASAPALNYLGGYEIGYRLQDSAEPNEFQRVALRIDAVPDGRPTQPLAVPPFCVGRAGSVGEIQAAGPELQFEGSGTYTVTVLLGEGSGGPSGCLSGPSTTGSFVVSAPVAPELVGQPLTFRADPLAGNLFVGVRANDPPGGFAEVRCARNGTVQPDGSVAGDPVVPDRELEAASVAEFDFTRPGLWLCVARGWHDGYDDDLESTVFGTPWSSPLSVDVGSDFRRQIGEIKRPRSRRPRFTWTAEWPEEAAGGFAAVTLFRVAGCKGRKFKLRKVARYRGQFGAERLRIRMRKPRAGLYLGRFKFEGTRFLRPGVDPNPMYVSVRGRRMGFAVAGDFPIC